MGVERTTLWPGSNNEQRAFVATLHWGPKYAAIAVARITTHDGKAVEWAAYIGAHQAAFQAKSSDEDVEHVALYGTKLAEDVAKLVFDGVMTDGKRLTDLPYRR